MAATFELSAILRFVDHATGPLRQASEKIKATSGQTVEWANRQSEALDRQRQALAGNAIETAAYGYALKRLIDPAIQFEQSMAQVRKVVDFDAPEGFDKLADDVLRLNTEGGLPMAADGILDIIAAAGQAGLVDENLPDAEKRAELIAFTEAAAKMGTAFDISGAEAGGAMAQWRAGLRLTQDEAISLGDAINHLSNNMYAQAPELVDVVRRQGAGAKTAGLAEEQIAALGASFLSGGSSP